MTRRLVLVRHGRTAWNHTKRVQGQTDVDLDDVGLAQAEQAATVLAGYTPDLVWCSDLRRARQTIAPIAAACGREVHYDARLREFSLGEREGLTHDEYRAIDAEEFDLFRAGYYDRAPGAEPTAVVRARMHEALTELLGLLPASGGTALALSHGAAIRVAVGALLGWPDDAFHTLRALGNCGWAEFVEHPEVGGLKLEAYHRSPFPPAGAAPARPDQAF
ncbi:histidine phosphatase family protein [Nocardioides sp.]|uniref:histidine phosphatase family protein n=1 Tax=Nocardioides sp. TaxID=35761 RepID=UPI0035163F8F